MSFVEFIRPTKNKYCTFINVVVIFNILQLLITANSSLFHKYHWNNGNAPSYFGISWDVLEKIFGWSALYPEGCSWICWPRPWAWIIVLAFWVSVWYLMACVIVVTKKYKEE